MNTRYAISSVFMGLLFISANAIPIHAQVTQVNLSASNCIPRSAGEFDQSGADGFRWNDSGASINTDDDENQDLICAVPYDPGLRRANGAMPLVEITVDVIDGHPRDEVRVDVFGQNGNVSAGVRLVTDSTTNAETGRRSLFVTFTPSVSLRYIWLRIHVPDSENGVRSGAVGYRTRRV